MLLPDQGLRALARVLEVQAATFDAPIRIRILRTAHKPAGATLEENI